MCNFTLTVLKAAETKCLWLCECLGMKSEPKLNLGEQVKPKKTIPVET